MSLVAVFLWRKNPSPNVCTLIINLETMKVWSPPRIFYFSKRLFSFKKEAKVIINNFMGEWIALSKAYALPVSIEHKIIFKTGYFSFIQSSAQSKYIYKLFFDCVNKLKKTNVVFKVQPQLRRHLSGRSLKMFKRALREMGLVSRKRGCGFEYNLWCLALHATNKTFASKLKRVRKKLIDNYWNDSSKLNF